MTRPTREPQRRAPRAPRNRTVRPIVEGLEERLLLFATNGGAWHFPSRVTFSFVPDGTNIGGAPSTLFSTLTAVAPIATWQQQFKNAAAIWSGYANINIAYQPYDSGADWGAQGDQQGDPNFGDIRISMIPQQPSVLAFAMLPPPINGGTDAGDITFNSNENWGINNNIDIETVALHEMGHALGLDHTPVYNAVMNAYYTGANQQPVADDVSGIQSVYGAQPADTDTNRSFAAATNITGLTDGNGQIAISNLHLSGGQDSDLFYVTAPANTTGTMTVSMQSTGLSSVAPRLAIYNNAKVGLRQVSVPNAYGTTATIQVTGVTPGQGFYIRAGAASGLGSFGAYGLLLNFGSAAQAPIAPPNTVVSSQPDQGGGSSGLSTGGGSGNQDGGNAGVVGPPTASATFDVGAFNPSGVAASTFHVNGKAMSFNDVVNDMKSAEARLSTDLNGSVNTILNDASLLMGALSQKHATGSTPYQDLQAVQAAARNRDLNAGVNALNHFFGGVVQVGATAGYGDALTIGTLRQDQTVHGRRHGPTHPVATPATHAPTVVSLKAAAHRQRTAPRNSAGAGNTTLHATARTHLVVGLRHPGRHGTAAPSHVNRHGYRR